jgi:hypothetical protein
MDIRHINLKNLNSLEALSAENMRERRKEELARMPFEIDDAELFKLRRELEEAENDGNLLASDALPEVEAASDKLQGTLRRRYAERGKLLAEKSLLMAETEKQRASAASAMKKIKKTKAAIIGLKDKSALDRAEALARQTLNRMEYNREELTRWDRFAVPMRLRHLRRLMGCPPDKAMQYENEFTGRMMWAKRGYTHSADYSRGEKLRNGEVAPYAEGNGYFIVGVNAGSIATPLEEMDYIGDGGYAAGYLALMEQMPEIIPMIRRGMSVDDILNDSGLRAKAAASISREYPVTVSKIGDAGFGERFQAIDLENQRRVVVARLFGVGLVAAKVETTLKDV